MQKLPLLKASQLNFEDASLQWSMLHLEDIDPLLTGTHVIHIRHDLIACGNRSSGSTAVRGHTPEQSIITVLSHANGMNRMSDMQSTMIMKLMLDTTQEIGTLPMVLPHLHICPGDIRLTTGHPVINQHPPGTVHAPHPVPEGSEEVRHIVDNILRGVHDSPLYIQLQTLKLHVPKLCYLAQ